MASGMRSIPMYHSAKAEHGASPLRDLTLHVPRGRPVRPQIPRRRDLSMRMSIELGFWRYSGDRCTGGDYDAIVICQYQL